MRQLDTSKWRRRLPKPGPFPVFVAIACGILLAGLFVGPGERELRTTAGGDELAADLDRRLSTGGAGDLESETEGTAAGGSRRGGGGAGSSGSGGGETGPGGDPAATASEPGAGAGPGGPVGGPGDPAGAAGANVRGVTDDGIRIGIALPDIGAFAVVDEFNLGDVRGHFDAMLDRWKREGRVPVDGRNVEFVYRSFNIVGDEDIAACNGFVKDDKVFAVIGLRSFTNGAECLADRFDTPIITLESFSEEGYARMHPYVFTLSTSNERIARNFVRWAHDRGALKDKTIGVYEETDAAALRVALERELNAHGYQITAEAQTNQKTGSPNDQIAVQRFQGADVDLALLLVSALPSQSFMEQARAQGYTPTYLAMDWADHTSDAASSVFPAAQYGGTFGVTTTRAGQIRAGQGLSGPGETCVKGYEEYSGRNFQRSSPESAEMVALLQACDEGEILLQGLHAAGRDLNRQTLIRGIEGIQNLEGASHGHYRFTANKHHGADSHRTAQWLGECSCWRAMSPFGPLWIG